MKTFRNRDNDYQVHPVYQVKPLASPKGMHTIKTKPLYRLPKGPDSYPAAAPVSIHPPGFDKTYTSKEIKALAKEEGQSDAAQYQKTLLKQKISQLKTQIDTVQTQIKKPGLSAQRQQQLEKRLEELANELDKVQDHIQQLSDQKPKDGA